MTEWKPIETAPQNGVSILSYISTGRAGWLDIIYWYGGEWCNMHDGLSGEPTHWMPVPLPPEETTSNQSKES